MVPACICLKGQELKSLLLGAGFLSAMTIPLACLLLSSTLTFANIILVFATSRGVVTAAANPPEQTKTRNTSETLLAE